MKGFDHSRLVVYQKSLRVAGAAQAVRRRLYRVDRILADQRARAIYSIVLNIAEGCAEHSGKEKARFYRIARRSAAEAAAALDLAAICGAATPSEITELQTELSEIAAMLTTLAKRFETPTPTPTPPSPSPSPSPDPNPKH